MAQVPVGTPAQRVAEEHRLLRELLAEIRSASGTPLSDGPDVVAAHLETLRERLSAHFEARRKLWSLFEQIEELAPEMTHECEALCAEHEGLLRSLDELREVRPEARREAAWGTGVNALLHALSSHEEPRERAADPSPRRLGSKLRTDGAGVFPARAGSGTGLLCASGARPRSPPHRRAPWPLGGRRRLPRTRLGPSTPSDPELVNRVHDPDDFFKNRPVGVFSSSGLLRLEDFARLTCPPGGLLIQSSELLTGLTDAWRRDASLLGPSGRREGRGGREPPRPSPSDPHLRLHRP